MGGCGFESCFGSSASDLFLRPHNESESPDAGSKSFSASVFFLLESAGADSVLRLVLVIEILTLTVPVPGVVGGTRLLRKRGPRFVV